MGDIQLPQNAVLTSEQLKQLGISRHRVAALASQDMLHRVERGVYTTAPPNGELLLAALSLRRPEAVVSGLTAFQLYSGQEITGPVSMRVPRGCSTKGSRLLRVRQSRTLHPREINGFRVVSPLATVADLLDHDEDALLRFLELQYSGREGPARLREDAAALGRVPGALRRLMVRAAVGADSNSERRVFRALRQRGVEVLQNHLIGAYRWDGVIPGAKVAIDIDSYRYHGIGPDGENHQTFVLDRWKANYAVREGYRVLRFTGECVYHHLQAVIREIMNTLEQPAQVRETPVWKWHHAMLFPEDMADAWD